ncbi:MAG TPA: serpin family protein [Polyangiales bacterium]|nr:serpin family protein [Polyangiales bacterium]
MRLSLILALAISVSIGLIGFSCSESSTTGDGAPGELVQSSKPRITSPDVSAEEVTRLSADNAEFAWAFYRQITKPGENLFFSPHSLSVALAMTWAGARGNTESEMAQAMHFTLGQERLHPAFNGLDLELRSRAEASSGDGPLPFALEVTNALFGQVGFEFLDPFLDTLAQHYGAGLRLMDFIDETEASRVAINEWVSERTNERIEELVAPGIITAMTRLVLVNAIFFTASWESPFDESNTTDSVFRRIDGTEAQVAMMQQSLVTSYLDGEGFEAAELPYDGNQLAMLLIVPDEGQLDTVEAELSAARIAEMRDALRQHQLDLEMPKFSFRSEVPAKAPLQALGMVDAFGGAADLSGMNGTGGLFIQDVVHQAFVAIDENGTEAAAATAVIVGETSAPPPATLVIDRPFVFAIIDEPTGATLFIGRVLDPSAG